ncbi:MAG: lipoyl(octanoyl) transferase LipB [Propionibacteriaceae bacterium]|jgi:lipoyl(octanoyl) transferase|nr:lipoyl(octanoyl) transferase LipB [Propionibacteriaceae bacterium]
MTALAFRRLGLDLTPRQLTDYGWAWAEQRRLHQAVVDGQAPDSVLLLEHASVYTAGRSTSAEDRSGAGPELVEVDRGGKVTWHGPGQLVGYPIVKLPSGIYVVDFVRRVEEALIRVLRDLGLTAGRVPGRTGVWLPARDGRPERKLAAIGLRVSRQVTMHGFALNVDPDLTAFDRIVPCGIRDAGVSSLAWELPQAPAFLAVTAAVEAQLADLLAFRDFSPSPDLPRQTRPGLDRVA